MKPKKMKMKGGNLEKNNVKDAKTPEPSFLREQKRERERERERKREKTRKYKKKTKRAPLTSCDKWEEQENERA